jgi:hypothetical protein
MPTLPDTIQQALRAKIDLFMGDCCEWKFDLTEQPDYVAALAKGSILVFANNGFGDYLFLKADGDRYGSMIYEYFHEGPEIIQIDDEIDLLLGLRERPFSNDDYPLPTYESGERVHLDDLVKIKIWVQFWKGRQDGRITYVPGVSAKKLKYEYGGLKWVAVRFKDGEICPLVDPKTGFLKKVRFISRRT